MNEARVESLSKKSWSISATAWEKFVLWLDEGSDSAGRSYLDMRDRLAAYFDRKNCRSPDELADETLDRVARRLEEEGTIETETPAKYCYTVARFVFLESLRSGEARSDSIEETSHSRELQAIVSRTSDESDERERMLSCLDSCACKLENKDRDLIFEYYVGTERAKIENRRSLSGRLGISVNALSIRAFRIREKLEACIRNCLKET